MIYLKAVLLAIVEGITEFLPISSTGHLILVEAFVELSEDASFNTAFMVIIQLPAIFAVVVYFWKDLWPYGSTGQRRRELYGLWSKIFVAVLPALVLGALFDEFMEEHLFAPLPVAVALFVGGVVILLVERLRHNARVETVLDISFRVAFAIGLFQCLAMFPGTSRSAATIIGAMVLGASRPAAAEFSFFLAIPTMLAAAAYSMLKSGLAFSGEQWIVLAVGSVVSFVVAYGAIRWFMAYVRQRSFNIFGYYRIGLAVLVYIALQAGWISAGN